MLDQIRGRSYEEAIMILEYMPYRACEPVLKTLLSAAANAKANLGLKKAKLVVSECFADQGPVLKRAQPRAQVRTAAAGGRVRSGWGTRAGSSVARVMRAVCVCGGECGAVRLECHIMPFGRRLHRVSRLRWMLPCLFHPRPSLPSPPPHTHTYLQGRAYKILKPMCHITIKVKEA